jgi:hypothetical protein
VPVISHLLFANDTLLMEATKEQAHLIEDALRRYEKSTGPLINPTKCSILFGADCMQANQERVKQILQIGRTTMEEKYLGLPTREGRMSKDKFQNMKEKLVRKFNNWAEKNMSSGAKEVMIKVVAQAIPTYSMGVFKLPVALCDEMTQLIRYFWWGEDAEHIKVHWIAWDKLLLAKNMGGMGFRDLRLFNQALLARHAWRLIQFPDSLCTCLLKAKYYPRGELIDTAFPSDVSPTWKGIEHGLDLVKKGIIWRVGSSTKIQIWRDSWITRPPSLGISFMKGRTRLRWVSQLMQSDRREWDV